MNLHILAESGGRANNFNLLRVLAAIAVLVSHCFPLTRGPEAAEPLNALLGHSLGKVAVLTFFVISGFFVSQSFHRCASLSDFIFARVLRIYPGLAVVLVFSVVLIGAMTTAMPIDEYYSDPSTFLYALNGLTLKWIQVGLPGVFLANPYPFAVNGSLWTLFYEVLCYAGAVLVALFIRASSRRRFIVFFAFWVSYVLERGLDAQHGFAAQTIVLRNCLDLVPAFVVGMIFFHYRAAIVLRWRFCAILGGMCIVSYRTPLFSLSFLVCLSYFVFMVGFISLPLVHAYNRVGDYSYGIYIYAFPVQQTVAWSLPGISAFGMLCIAAPIVAVLSIASWHLVERPALRYREHFRMKARRSQIDVASRA